MSYYGRQYGYSPSVENTTYEITLKGAYYELKRNCYENVDGYIPELQPHKMQSIYNGRLFDIIAETLYESIAQYIIYRTKHKSYEDNRVPGRTDVWIAINVKLPQYHEEWRYVKLDNQIDYDVFKEKYEGEENKKRTVSKWANIIKSSELVKPFLNRETTFISWNPGKGSSYNTSHSVRNSINNHTLQQGWETNSFYDPEISKEERIEYVYVGVLKIDPPAEYVLPMLQKDWMKLLDEKASHITSSWKKLKEIDPENNEDFLQNMTQDEALDFSILTKFACRKKHNNWSGKVEIDTNWTGATSKELPPYPVIGDKALKSKTDENKDDFVSIDQYVKLSYPKFYKRVEELVEQAKMEVKISNHNAAQERYDRGHTSLSSFSDKETHIKIIEAFQHFNEVYEDEKISFDTTDDIYAYLNDVYGCVVEYLNKFGEERINQNVQKKYHNEIKLHPRTKDMVIGIPDSVYPYNVETINKALEFEFVEYENELYSILQQITSCVGAVFPQHVSGQIKQQVNLKKNCKNMELGEFAPKGRVNKVYGVHVTDTTEEIRIDYQLVVSNAVLSSEVWHTREEIRGSFNIKQTDEMVEFKQLVFELVSKCFTGKFNFEIKNKLWDSDIPPYVIYMEKDEEQVKKVVDTIKANRTYQKMLWLKQRNIEWEQKRREEREQWRKEHARH